MTSLTSNGYPSVCARITARVRGDSAASSWITSAVICGSFTSTNTGIAPTCNTGLMVVGKLTAVVITSSPGCNSSADIASRLADEPELHRMTWRTPRYSRSFFSNLAHHGPAVYQSELTTSIRLARSVLPQMRPWTGTFIAPAYYLHAKE